MMEGSSSMKPMEYAGVISAEDQAREMGGGPKMGHKCCGGCCDMRRAVIICDIILLVAGVLSLAVEGLAELGASAVANMSFDDDLFQNADDDVTKNMQNNLAGSQEDLKAAEAALYVVMIMTVIGLVTTSASIWGAFTFNYIPVAVNGVFLALRGVVPFFMGAPNFFALTAVGLWLYPHVVFCIEVRSGILSRASYAREEFSCCCISKKMVIMEQPGVAVADAEII